MFNIWRWTAKQKNGKPVESAPGMTAFVSRGPTSEAEMRREGQRLLNARAQLEWMQSGQDAKWENPQYEVDKVEGIGNSEQTDANIGFWQPPGTAPVALPVPATDSDDSDA